MTNDPHPGAITVAPAGRPTAVSDALPPAPPDTRLHALVDARAQALLAEVGRRLFGSLDLHYCLRSVAEIAAGALADAVVVVGPSVAHAASTRVRLVAGGTIEASWAAQREITDVPGMAEAVDSYPPVPGRRVDPRSVPSWVLPPTLGPAGEALLLPMPGYAGPGGALLLIRRVGALRFTADDEALARVFAARAGAAVSAAALHQEQTETLAVLQAELVPPQLPHIQGVELAGTHQPSKDSMLTGGDFYDAFPAAGGSQAVVLLGDVCGKGAAAAALTGRVRQTLRALHRVERHPARLLSQLNDVLLRPDGDEPFVTLVIGSLAVAPEGQVHLTFATGGHPAPLVLRHDGRVEEVDATGTLIGVVPEVSIGTASVTLAAGELCLLYSDGVTEARGGRGGSEQYDERRLQQALATCRGMPAAAVLARLRRSVAEWTRGGATDDIALLAVRATRP